MNEWTEFCRACCHFLLYMLCRCHAFTNPAGPLPSTCHLMCLRMFRVCSQGQNWLIVIFMLMCLLNPVNDWSCVQNQFYVSTIPLLLLYVCVSRAGVKMCRCVNPWLCSYDFTSLSFCFISTTPGTEGSLSEGSTPKSIWTSRQSKMHSGI